MSMDHLDRRLTNLEAKHEKMADALSELLVSTSRIGELLEQQKACLPRIEEQQRQINALQISVSNAQLVQRGVIWLGGLVGSSAVIMAMTYLFKG